MRRPAAGLLRSTRFWKRPARAASPRLSRVLPCAQLPLAFGRYLQAGRAATLPSLPCPLWTCGPLRPRLARLLDLEGRAVAEQARERRRNALPRPTGRTSLVDLVIRDEDPPRRPLLPLASRRKRFAAPWTRLAVGSQSLVPAQRPAGVELPRRDLANTDESIQVALAICRTISTSTRPGASPCRARRGDRAPTPRDPGRGRAKSGRLAELFATSCSRAAKAAFQPSRTSPPSTPT